MSLSISLDNPDLPVCAACGTEFDQPRNGKPLENCVICDVRALRLSATFLSAVQETFFTMPRHAYTLTKAISLTPTQDPRQYVPPSGQKWTTRSRMAKDDYSNTWTQIDDNPNFWSIITTPKFAIGQRAILVKTPRGNILWDCLTHLDDATVAWIESQGGLKAIVISHPHYYSSHMAWAEVFDCPVYISAADEAWVQRANHGGRRRLLGPEPKEILRGVTAITTGGHFPGSLVLHVDLPPAIPMDVGMKPRLLVADTLVTVPSALYAKNRPKGTTSYAFMWSIPNMIPLPPGEMRKMWKALEGWEFGSTHGAFVGLDVREGDGGGSVKERVRESMRIQARGEGWEAALGEEWP